MITKEKQIEMLWKLFDRTNGPSGKYLGSEGWKQAIQWDLLQRIDRLIDEDTDTNTGHIQGSSE